jgi:hypothetical protein
VLEGHWVLLANCHLMMSWLGELDKIIEGMPARQPHPKFRLWLSSAPLDSFPIGILQVRPALSAARLAPRSTAPPTNANTAPFAPAQCLTH